MMERSECSRWAKYALQPAIQLVKMSEDVAKAFVVIVKASLDPIEAGVHLGEAGVHLIKLPPQELDELLVLVIRHGDR